MHFTPLIISSLPILGSLAAPLASRTVGSSSKVARACAPISSPTAPYTVVASMPNTPIHYLTMNAGPDNKIILGGEPDAYCELADQTLCPPGAYTVFSGFGSLYVSVPGGQQVYAAPDGHFGFTAAHSAATPDGAILDPFTYDKQDQCNSPNGVISTQAFGAAGLMACPTKADTTDPSNVWEVFADITNAVVPTGYKGDCISFQGLTYDYNDPGNYNAAAWAYA